MPIKPAARTVAGDWRFVPLPEFTPSDSALAFGSGRSYGDSCINSDATQLNTAQLNRFITFDVERGLLRCESGVTLDEILRLIVPKGWFLPVVPGTRYITLGGAIANDVHGKNHHRAGSFGCHVRALTLLRSDGSRHVCSPADRGKLFAATIGGLGLTGLIIDAVVQLVPIASPCLAVEEHVFSNMQEFFALSSDSADWDYTVSWLDTCARKNQLGRGIFSRARHVDRCQERVTRPTQKSLTMPFAPPFSLVNQWTVDLFNRAYYWAGSRKSKPMCLHYQPWLFPLDAINHWNRIYGSKGFYQYQCVLPRDGQEQAIDTLLRDIQRSGQASFLVVLKEFGDHPAPGLLSFARPGLTLALDFPNRGAKTKQLLESFDRTVLSVGGALYPAKDARMSAQMFHAGFPQVELFKSQIDPHFSSAFWRRVQT